jgi:hypothetical protein
LWECECYSSANKFRTEREGPIKSWTRPTTMAAKDSGRDGRLVSGAGSLAAASLRWMAELHAERPRDGRSRKQQLFASDVDHLWNATSAVPSSWYNARACVQCECAPPFMGHVRRRARQSAQEPAPADGVVSRFSFLVCRFSFRVSRFSLFSRLAARLARDRIAFRHERYGGALVVSGRRRGPPRKSISAGGFVSARVRYCDAPDRSAGR